MNGERSSHAVPAVCCRLHPPDAGMRATPLHESTMTRTTRCYALLCALLLIIGFAPGSPTVAAEMSGGAGSPKRTSATGKELIRAAAEVLAVDVANRSVKLKREDGNTLTVIADKRVGNLAQVSVGDIVIVQYGHARAISLRKIASSEPLSTPGPQSRTQPPKRALIADLIAIDDRTGQATLKGDDDTIVDVVFRNRNTLAAVRIGDRVRLEYTDAIAVSIRPAGQTVTPRRPQPH